MATPSTIGTVGFSSRFTEMLIKITNMGMREQMIAAMPLGIYTSAHVTNPLPRVNMSIPPMAWRIICSRDGIAVFVNATIKPMSNSPDITWRNAVKRKGGKCCTAIRSARYVVPQIIHTAINARYGKKFF
jgi:hypothetical protein